MIEPLARNFFPGAVDDFDRKVGNHIKPGLKRIERCYFFVDGRSEIEAVQGRIVEFPMRAVEGEAMVNHLGEEADAGGGIAFEGRPNLGFGSEEDGLTGVGIGDPFVKYEGAEEVDTVFYLAQELFREKIEQGDLIRIDGQAGAKMQARRRTFAAGAETEVDVGILSQERGGDLNQGGLWDVDL